MSCDYCDEGLPLVDGWHIRSDPEGLEGDQRIPCSRRVNEACETGEKCLCAAWAAAKAAAIPTPGDPKWAFESLVHLGSTPAGSLVGDGPPWVATARRWRDGAIRRVAADSPTTALRMLAYELQQANKADGRL